MATSIIDEFVTLLGIDLKSDTMQKVRRFEQSLDSIGKIALGVVAAISASAASVAYFTEKAVESASRLDKFSELTGESAQALQRWGYAAEQAGGNAKSAQSDIMGLVKAMNPVMPGEFNHGLFMLGMYEKKYKSVSDMLVDLSGKFKGMDPGKSLNWAAQVGISPEFLLLLRRGPGAVKELMSQTPFLMSDAELKKARELETLVNRIKYSFKTVGSIIAVGIAPQIEKVLVPMGKWIEKNHALISSRLNEFLAGVSDGFEKVWHHVSKVKEWVEKTFPKVDAFTESLFNANTVGHITASVLMAIAIALAAASIEWIAIGAAVALAALAVDDFCTYLEGGKSLIGDTIGYVKNLYNEFSTKFPHIAKFVSIVAEGLKDLGKVGLDVLIKSVKALWEGLKMVGEGWSYIITPLLNLMDRVLTPFVDGFDDSSQPMGPDEYNKEWKNPNNQTNGTKDWSGVKIPMPSRSSLDRPTAPITNNNGGNKTVVNHITENHTWNVQTKSHDAYGTALELQLLFPNHRVQGQAAGAQ